MHRHKIKPSCKRVNLQPNAARDETGRYLLHSIPSERVSEGPVIDAVRRLLPYERIEQVQVNKFTTHNQCQPHRDKNNQGRSRLALFGNFSGGALATRSGRAFKRKRCWHAFDGTTDEHWVEPFKGERMSVVVYSGKQAKKPRPTLRTAPPRVRCLLTMSQTSKLPSHRLSLTAYRIWSLSDGLCKGQNYRLALTIAILSLNDLQLPPQRV